MCLIILAFSVFNYCQLFFCRWKHLLPPLFLPLLLLLPLYLRAPPATLWFTLSLSPQPRLVSPLSPLLCTLLNTRTRFRKTPLLPHHTLTQKKHSKSPLLMLIPPHATTKHLLPFLSLAVTRARRFLLPSLTLTVKMDTEARLLPFLLLYGRLLWILMKWTRRRSTELLMIVN